MPEENIHDLLQVESTVDSRAIRAAYRRVMLLHHPDRSPGPDVQEMTQRLNDAYEVLCNLERRAAYDNGLFGWVEGLTPELGPVGTGPTPGKGTFSGISNKGRSGWHVSGFIDRYHRERRCGYDEFRGARRRPLNRAGSRVETNLDYHSTVHSQSDTTNNGSPTTVPIPNVTAAPTAAFHLKKCAVFIESGDFERAADAFTSELNLNPNYVYGHQIRGFSYYQTGQYRLTIADFNQALQLGPGYAFAFSRRGLACDQL